MTVQFSSREKHTNTPQLRPISGIKLLLIVGLNILLAGYVFWAYRSAYYNELPTQRNPILQNLRQRGNSVTPD
ncbi:hypothetical protein BRW62_08465 [Parathermosynechococcus lividus PCC 6715]|uniref:Uncharacterized protein n=1 Tax=Parathermosynechococcus lividus PCC 6715 TaxID=1917166 RepID=A0A2D2Q2R1_PARLV|nr:hypothetical protein [Thermostichus lividus]ATS18776.1 hypothetical protein BRW62_08465 [Thermostichus lividus PCC 6715]